MNKYKQPNQHFLTVCVPTYNRASFLPACIESILQQTYGRFELLIVDNHSQDNSVEVVKRYHDKRIRLVINDTNVGLWGNHNVCINLAKADWIVFVHSDEQLEKSALGILNDSINARAGDDTGILIGVGNHPSLQSLKNIIDLGSDLYMPYSLLAVLGGIGNPTGMCYKKSALQASGGFNENPNIHSFSDHQLLATLAEKGYRFHLIDFAYVRGVPGAHQDTYTLSRLKIYSDMISFVNRLIDLPVFNGVYELLIMVMDKMPKDKQLKFIFMLSVARNKAYTCKLLMKHMKVSPLSITNRTCQYAIGNVLFGKYFYSAICSIHEVANQAWVKTQKTMDV